MENSFWKKYSKPVSSIKSKPKKIREVSESDIERLNYSVGKKLKQNEKERRESILDAEEKIVK